MQKKLDSFDRLASARARSWRDRGMRWVLGALAVYLFGALPSIAHADPTEVSVLKMDAAVGDEPAAQRVTSVLIGLLHDSESVKPVERTEMTIGDMALIYGCEAETPECLSLVATDLGGDQILYGSVEPFAEEVTIKLFVYDASKSKVKPVYSRRIVLVDLEKVLAADLSDLLFGEPWELPSYLELTVDGGVTASVTIGDEAYGTSPLQRARVRSGRHLVEVTAPGFERWTRTVAFESGKPVQLDVTLRSRSGDVGGGDAVAIEGNGDGTGVETGAPSDLPPVEETYSAPTSAWVVLGLGSALLIGGTVTGVLALDAEGAYEEELRQRQADEIKKRGESLALATNVMLAAGGLAIAASAVMFFTLGEWERADGVSVRLDTTPLPDGALLRLRGRF